MLKFSKKILAFILIISLVSCVSYKPIFDENEKFLNVGKDIAYKDFEDCDKNSDKYLDEYKSKRIANEMARKALLGSVIGGITGFIFGNSTKSLIKGAFSGALVGGVVGGISSAGSGKLTEDSLKKNYITKCLNKSGYEIIGWY